MVPPNLNFWSISREESLETQQKHALRNRFIRILLCWNDIFNPGYSRKMLMRKRTSILGGVFLNSEQLFHPAQCTSCRICQCSSSYKFVLPEVTGILLFSDQLHYLWGMKCFKNGTRQSSSFPCRSGRLHILSSNYYLLSILGKIFFLWIQSFQGLAIAAFQLQSV